jgi:hypothetical protein
VRTVEVEAETMVVEAGERRCGADPAGRSIVEAMGVRRSRRGSRGEEARRWRPAKTERGSEGEKKKIGCTEGWR